MSHHLTFRYELQYRELQANAMHPALDVTLIGPTGEEDLLPIIDTGATYCLFDGRRAASIGLELQVGSQLNLSGLAGGKMRAYLHPVELEIFGHRFKCDVAFSEHELSRELLLVKGVADTRLFALVDVEEIFVLGFL